MIVHQSKPHLWYISSIPQNRYCKTSQEIQPWPQWSENVRFVSILSFVSNIIKKIISFSASQPSIDWSVIQPIPISIETCVGCPAESYNWPSTLSWHGNVFALTLLDLLSAFDTRDYTILYQLVEHVFDTQSTALQWFPSCLSNTTHTVAANDCSSAPVPISCGVLHGWLWDPFSLFWIPQPSLMLSTVTLCSSPFFCFADDSLLQKSAPLRQFHELAHYLQERIHNVTLNRGWPTINSN